MTTSEQPERLQRNTLLAVLAIVIAALVPIALAYGVDLCSPLDAVGIELDACAPAPAPSPGAPDDAGVQQ